MYKCKECGELFDEPKTIIIDRHLEVSGCNPEYWDVSPCCQEDFTEMQECFRCGEYTEDVICDDCLRKDMTFEHLEEYIEIYELWDDFLLGFYCKTSQKPNDTLREITRLSFETLNKNQQTETMKRYIQKDFVAYEEWYRGTL